MAAGRVNVSNKTSAQFLGDLFWEFTSNDMTFGFGYADDIDNEYIYQFDGYYGRAYKKDMYGNIITRLNFDNENIEAAHCDRNYIGILEDFTEDYYGDYEYNIKIYDWNQNLIYSGSFQSFYSISDIGGIILDAGDVYPIYEHYNAAYIGIYDMNYNMLLKGLNSTYAYHLIDRKIVLGARRYDADYYINIASYQKGIGDLRYLKSTKPGFQILYLI